MAEDGYKLVENIDYSPVVIDQMRNGFPRKEGIECKLGL